MLLAEPQRTDWDLNFNLIGFPVRVHPLFFVMPLLLGGGILQGYEGNTGAAVLVIIGVFFLSILVHELGHALAFRRYGYDCEIVLYWMGGLAIPRTGMWRGSRPQALIPPRQIVVSFAGPFFGFLLAGLLTGVLYLLGGKVVVFFVGVFPILAPRLENSAVAGNEAMYLFFFMGLWANVFWSILNLLPVFPLDGGQIARQCFIMADPWDGIRKSLIFAMVVAGLVALWAMSRQDQFMGIMFIYLGIMNYMEFQQTASGGRRW